VSRLKRVAVTALGTCGLVVATATPAWAGGGHGVSGSVGYNPSSIGALVNVLSGSPGGGSGPAPGGYAGGGNHSSGGGGSGHSSGGGGGPTGPPPYIYLPTGLVPGPNGQQGLYAVVNPNNTSGANTAACGGTAFCFVPMGGPTPAAVKGPTGPPPPSPGQLALQAANQLNLVAPRIQTSPNTLDGHSPDTPVNFLTWLWLGGGLSPQSVTASAGGVSATTTATPTSQVSFEMGDGGSVSCNGPGTPWSLALDPTGGGADPSGCAYTYHQSTDGRGPFTITATVGYTVSWTSNVGQSGTLPGLTARSSAALNVDQIESVVTRSS